MDRRRALVAVSAADLAQGVVALAVAVRRGRHYDALGLRGRADRVGRDALWAGTALNPPVWCSALQAWATVRLARHDDGWARPALGLLLLAYVPGHAVERFGREALRRRDPVEAPLVLAGAGLAALGSVLALRPFPGAGRRGMASA
jgi:hypothetical protein